MKLLVYFTLALLAFISSTAAKAIPSPAPYYSLLIIVQGDHDEAMATIGNYPSQEACKDAAADLLAQKKHINDVNTTIFYQLNGFCIPSYPPPVNRHDP